MGSLPTGALTTYRSEQTSLVRVVECAQVGGAIESRTTAQAGRRPAQSREASPDGADRGAWAKAIVSRVGDRDRSGERLAADPLARFRRRRRVLRARGAIVTGELHLPKAIDGVRQRRNLPEIVPGVNCPIMAQLRRGDQVCMGRPRILHT